MDNARISLICALEGKKPDRHLGNGMMEFLFLSAGMFTVFGNALYMMGMFG